MEMVPEKSTKFPELTELPKITRKFQKEMEIPVKVRKLWVSYKQRPFI